MAITEEKNVVVSEEGLKQVLEELKILKEKTVILESIADKTELAKYFEKTKDRTKRACRLRCLRNDKGEQRVVVFWGPMITNETWQNQNGVTVAKQVIKVKDEDGMEIVGDLLDIGRRYEFISAEKVGELKDETGNTIWEVKADNGKTYKIDIRFIN